MEKWEYYFENHDWDMTLGAAKELLDSGQRVQKDRGQGHHLSYYTGAMLLSFCAFESFINSLAFLIHRGGNSTLNYRKYTRIKSVFARLAALEGALGISLDRSRQPFSTLEQMRNWRNEMVHSQPFLVEPTLIEDPSRALEVVPRSQSYLTQVTRSRARAFYRASYLAILRLQRASGLDATTYVSYRQLETNQTVRIERRTVKLG